MNPDAFEDLARYYDALMIHVDYDRWFMVTTSLAEMLPHKPRHLDAACGTGVFAKRLLKTGWTTVGMDLSPSMIATARTKAPKPAAVVADLRAIPFVRTFDIVTCLFDSINFLLRIDDVRRAVSKCADALVDGGILYFDVVTERMVTEYFEDQEWEEDNDAFSSRWRSTYDRKHGIAETRVRVNHGQECVVRERIYALETIRSAVEKAGLNLLGVYDAKTWRAPTKRTVRVDVVAGKGAVTPLRKRFAPVRARITTRLREMDY